MTVTNEQIDEAIDVARDDRYWTTSNEIIVALADQRAELVALLRDGDTGCDGSDDGDDDQPCWGCRASVLLARIGVTQ